MASSLDDIQRLLQEIRDELPALVQRSQIAPSQVVIVNGLSDLSERLGLLQAGEFRTGNSKEPGFGFSGVRMGYPAFTYGGSTYNLVGVNDDVLQFGLSATDGKAYFAAGAGIIDTSGLTLRGSEYPTASALVQWKDSNGVITGQLVNQYLTGTAGNLWFEAVCRTGEKAYVSLITSDVGEAGGADPLTAFQIQSDGDVIINLENASLDGAGNQFINVLTNKNITNVPSPILSLRMKSKGTAANGLGIYIPIFIENGSGTDVEIGRISWIYTDVTNGSEDSKVTVHYMLNGVLTEKQIAP